MKVYSVIGGYDYGGERFHTLRLFYWHSAAVEYMHHLEEDAGYDYSILDTREVCMESSIYPA